MSGAPTSILCALWAAAMLTPLLQAGEEPILTGGAVANGPVELPSVADLERRPPASGDPVDIFVNDRHVARGEILVLNETFCVRVGEIIAGGGEES